MRLTENEVFQKLGVENKGLTTTKSRENAVLGQPPMLKNKHFWILSLICSATYFLIKYQGGAFAEFMYNSGHPILAQNLGQYLGYQQEHIFGPITQIICGGLLTFLCLRYFTNAKPLTFFLLIFAYLLITKWETLFFPPYGEACTGPIMEGLWLADHGFNYVRLAHQAPTDQGGPKTYLFSLYPSLIALLKITTPTTKAFLFICHTINFAITALIVTVFRSISRRYFSEITTLLSSILLLSLPLFQSMTEVINMEMPTLFFVIISCYYLTHRRIILASTFAILASFMKGSGAMACVTILIISISIIILDKNQTPKNRRKYLFCGTLTFLMGFIKIFLRPLIYKVSPPHSTFKFLVGIAPLSTSKWLITFYGISLITIGYILIKECLINKTKTNPPFFTRYYIPLIMFTFTTMWYALYVNVSVMGPRYKLLLTPFLLFCCIFTVVTLIKHKKACQRILIFSILISCLASYGLFHPRKVESGIYSFNELERSLEYRNDLKLDILLAKTLAKDYSSFTTIGAPQVIAQQLTTPSLGYVDTPLNVIIYDITLSRKSLQNFNGSLKNFRGLQNINLRKTLWVGLKNTIIRNTPYPITKKDIIIKKLMVGNKKATLFIGGFAIERRARMVTLLNIKLQKSKKK